MTDMKDKASRDVLNAQAIFPPGDNWTRQSESTPIQLRSRWSHFDTPTYNLTVETAREIVADLQAQLAALEPRDAMIAEAERQMVAAYSYALSLNAVFLYGHDESKATDQLRRAVISADQVYQARLYAWSVLVAARDEAKGGAT